VGRIFQQQQVDGLMLRWWWLQWQARVAGPGDWGGVLGGDHPVSAFVLHT